MNRVGVAAATAIATTVTVVALAEPGPAGATGGRIVKGEVAVVAEADAATRARLAA